MEIIYLYCAFSYLFMIGAVIAEVNHSPSNSVVKIKKGWDDFFIYSLQVVIAPALTPVLMGIEFHEVYCKKIS